MGLKMPNESTLNYTLQGRKSCLMASFYFSFPVLHLDDSIVLYQSVSENIVS